MGVTQVLRFKAEHDNFFGIHYSDFIRFGFPPYSQSSCPQTIVVLA